MKASTFWIVLWCLNTAVAVVSVVSYVADRSVENRHSMSINFLFVLVCGLMVEQSKRRESSAKGEE